MALFVVVLVTHYYAKKISNKSQLAFVQISQPDPIYYKFDLSELDFLYMVNINTLKRIDGCFSC